jgi:hypothetical protein
LTEAYVTVLAGGRIELKVGTAETVLNWFWVLTPTLKLTEIPWIGGGGSDMEGIPVVAGAGVIDGKPVETWALGNWALGNWALGNWTTLFCELGMTSMDMDSCSGGMPRRRSGVSTRKRSITSFSGKFVLAYW